MGMRRSRVVVGGRLGLLWKQRIEQWHKIFDGWGDHVWVFGEIVPAS